MKLAIAQLNYIIGDFESNKIKIINAINRAKADGADLIAFAEMAICGTPAYDLLNKIDFLNLCEEALIEIAAFSDGISVLVGLPIQHGTHTVSAAAYIHNRKIIHYITRKNVTHRDDVSFLKSGKGSEFIKIGDHKVAVVVGEDILHPDDFSGYADTVINIGGSRYARQIIEKRYDGFKVQSFMLGANLVFVNQLGGQTDVIYDGSSVIFDSKGQPLALLDRFGEDYYVIDLDKPNEPVEIPYQDKTENVYNALKLGLKDFFHKNGYKRACVGFSGGIDSAVVLAIAAEVLGGENINALLMPSQFSSTHSIHDSITMAKTLGIKTHIVPITEIYKDIVGSMAPVFGQDNTFGVAEENIQARIRGVLLMALSNKFGDILLNTSNKSELALGWGTLYGDNTGVISIIGDLYKGEVFDLARYINRHGEIIPENILLKEPSAELRPGQKDVDELPPYDQTDAIIYRMIEEKQSREEIINAGFDAAVVYKIYGMIIKNEQKRYQFCPTLRVSTCTFGIDRRMPITSKYGF